MQRKFATRNSQLATRNYSNGFTLTELLVVIGIITILIGILLPVINRVRRIAYVADTQNEISQISNACNQYYTTFHAYPGPLSNDQIEDTNTTNKMPPQWEYYIQGKYIAMPAPGLHLGSGPENLVLGLMGGLRVDQSTASTINGQPVQYTLAFAPSEVGLGPLSLSPSFPGRTPSFFSAGSNYLMWCQQLNSSSPVVRNNQYQPSLTTTAFTDAAGIGVDDAPIPIFVDRFPAPGPLPILYLRARTGARGIVSDGGIGDPTTRSPALYQYDIRDISAYTGTSIGLPLPPSGSFYYHDLSALGNIVWPLRPPGPIGAPYLHSPIVPAGPPNPSPGPTQTISTNTKSIADAFSYFINQSIPPTDSTNPDGTGRPRAVDQFILISAGPDGIYGTSDDITSFGDVSQ